MKSAFRPVIVACAGLAALVVSGTALAAFTSPKLTISTPAGGGLAITAEQVREDDAPFQLIIYVPSGYTAQLVPTEGAQLGTVVARAQANAISPDAILELTGQIVGDPTFTPQEYPTGLLCLAAAGVTGPPAAVYRLVLTAAGQTLIVPLYAVPASGAETAFASAKLIGCLSSPYIPQASGGAPFGAKLISATLTFPSLFTAPTGGAELRWRSIWTPYIVPTANANLAGRVEAQALAPSAGRLALRAGAYNRRTRQLSVRGNLTQAGTGAVGTVRILRGNRIVKVVRTTASGTFSTTIRILRAGRYSLRATATAAAREQSGCMATLPGVNCLRTTTAGVTATSATVRVRIR
jgi:hypothetical protein